MSAIPPTIKVVFDDEQMAVLLSDIAELNGRIEGMEEAARMRFESIERRIEKMERKLNHKGGDE